MTGETISLWRTCQAAQEVLRTAHTASDDGPIRTDPVGECGLSRVTCRRREAFEQLKDTIGTDPEAILATAQSALERVTARGILKGTFAAKLRECARIAIEDFGGDLEAVIRGPLDKAKRALRTLSRYRRAGSREDPALHRSTGLARSGIERPSRAGAFGIYS